MTRTRVTMATSTSWHEALAEKLRTQGGVDVSVVRSREELDVEALRKWGPRYVFFPHWSYRIPREIFTEFECVVFHMTDLPFGRGGTPLQNLVIRGHETTVVSALRCVEELDAGPIYMKRPLSLAGTAREIYARASDVIGEMMLDLLRDQPQPVPQAGPVTHFQRRRPEDGNLASARSAKEIYDMIRMLDADGYPAAFLETSTHRVSFTDAELQGDNVVAKAVITFK